MNKEEIHTLADLSRINLTESEIESYAKDFQGILGYIDTLATVTIDERVQDQKSPNINYLREDDNSYVSGEFSKELLMAAPDTEGQFIKVQKIL